MDIAVKVCVHACVCVCAWVCVCVFTYSIIVKREPCVCIVYDVCVIICSRTCHGFHLYQMSMNVLNLMEDVNTIVLTQLEVITVHVQVVMFLMMMVTAVLK